MHMHLVCHLARHVCWVMHIGASTPCSCMRRAHQFCRPLVAWISATRPRVRSGASAKKRPGCFPPSVARSLATRCITLHSCALPCTSHPTLAGVFPDPLPLRLLLRALARSWTFPHVISCIQLFEPFLWDRRLMTSPIESLGAECSRVHRSFRAVNPRSVIPGFDPMAAQDGPATAWGPIRAIRSRKNVCSPRTPPVASATQWRSRSPTRWGTTPIACPRARASRLLTILIEALPNKLCAHYFRSARAWTKYSVAQRSSRHMYSVAQLGGDTLVRRARSKAPGTQGDIWPGQRCVAPWV